MARRRRQPGWPSLPLLSLALLWLLAMVPAWPADLTGLEQLAHRQPALALERISALRETAEKTGAALRVDEAALLHLWAAEAQNQLAQGRLALTEADAGLALLGPLADDAALALTPVRLQLARASALDLIGESHVALPALDQLLQALELQQPVLQQQIIEALVCRGSLLVTLNDASGALKDLQRAYLLTNKDDLRVAHGEISAVLGNLYTVQFDSENAIIHYKDALEHYQRTGAKVRLSIAVYGLGSAYRDMRNWPEARRHFGWSLELSREQGDLQGVAYAQKELAGIAIENGELKEAQALLDAAQPLLEQADDQLALISIAIMRANLAGKRGRYDDAEAWLSRAETLSAKSALQWLDPRIWLARATLLAAQQKFAEAYRAHQRFHELHERNFRSDTSKNLQSLRIRFESELRDQQNIQLRAQNAQQEAALSAQRSRLLLYIAVAALAVTLVVFLLYFLHKGQQLRARLDAIAHVDELTGLPNRRFLMQAAHQEVERARRYRMPLALAVLDLDHFKTINDRFGHAVSDDVLRQFASRCRDGLRQMDTLGRIGGEEFVLVLPHTGVIEAEPLLERLRQHFRGGDWRALQGRHQPTVSIGLTELGAADQSLADLLRRADEALYQSKRDGRDRITVQRPAQPFPAAAVSASGETERFEKY